MADEVEREDNSIDFAEDGSDLGNSYDTDESFGTILIVLKTLEGIYMLADSRVCRPQVNKGIMLIRDNGNKIFPIDKRVEAMCAGNFGTFQCSREILKKKIILKMKDHEEPYLDYLVTSLKEMLPQHYNPLLTRGCTMLLVDAQCLPMYEDDFSVACLHIRKNKMTIKWLRRRDHIGGFVRGAGVELAEPILKQWNQKCNNNVTSNLCERAMEEVAKKKWTVGGYYTRMFLNLEKKWAIKTKTLESSLRPSKVAYMHGEERIELEVKFIEEESGSSSNA